MMSDSLSSLFGDTSVVTPGPSHGPSIHGGSCSRVYDQQHLLEGGEFQRHTQTAVFSGLRQVWQVNTHTPLITAAHNSITRHKTPVWMTSSSVIRGRLQPDVGECARSGLRRLFGARGDMLEDLNLIHLTKLHSSNLRSVT